jgi:DNA-binding beta-propeller fold protein YncE
VNPSGGQEQPSAEEQIVAEEAEGDLAPEDNPYADIPEEFRPRGSEPGEGLESGKAEGPVLLNFVTIDSNGKLYMVSNETGKVYVYGPDETFLFSFGTKGGSPGQMSQPRAMAIDEEQELIYVVDFMRHTILIYNLEGEYLYEVGGKGTEPGWFKNPTGMTINKHRQIIVADLFNSRVQVLELGYEEWQNRNELEPPPETSPNETDADTGKTSEQEGIISEDTGDLANQKGTTQKRTVDEFEILIQQAEPQAQSETKDDLDLVPELNQGQPEDVQEVIFSEKELPSYPETKD